MKKKNIFKFIFVLYLVVITLMASVGYAYSSRYIINNYLSIPWHTGNDMLDHFLRTIDKHDEEYVMYEYIDVTKDVEANLNDIYLKSEKESAYIYDDIGIDYTIINLKTKQKTNSLGDITLSDDVIDDQNYMYGIIEFSKNGIVQSHKRIDSANSFIETPYMVYYTEMRECLKMHHSNPDEHLKLNIPNDYQIIYRMDLSKYHDSRIIHDIYNSYSFYEIAVMFVCIVALITFVFMLFMPYDVFADIRPFKLINKLKLLFVLLFLGSFTVVSGAFMSYIGDLILSPNQLHSQYLNGTILNILGCLSCLIFVYGVSLCSFYLKYIFKKGIVTFIKEDTLIVYLFTKFKSFLVKLTELDLANRNNRNLFIFILINVIALSLMTMLRGFGIIFIVIYGMLAYIFLKERIDNIRLDYFNVLCATKKLASGNFDDEVFKDTGIFTSLQDELKNIKEGFKKAVIEETKSSKMKTELITNISHDLKTPLTGIKNYIELLDNDELDQKTRKTYLKTLDNYVNRFKVLIDDLFEVSKVNSGNIKLNLSELDIVTLIKQVIDENDDILNEHNLKVLFNSHKQHLNLMLDGDKTYRIFNNLLINAGKYSLDNSRIYIDLVDNEDEVMIIFKNISREEMTFTSDEILERFVRGDKSRTDGGSGLGLAIVKSFTEAQGGNFEVMLDGDLFKAIIKFKITKGS